MVSRNGPQDQFVCLILPPLPLPPNIFLSQIILYVGTTFGKDRCIAKSVPLAILYPFQTLIQNLDLYYLPEL